MSGWFFVISDIQLRRLPSARLAELREEAERRGVSDQHHAGHLGGVLGQGPQLRHNRTFPLQQVRLLHTIQVSPR